MKKLFTLLFLGLVAINVLSSFNTYVPNRPVNYYSYKIPNLVDRLIHSKKLPPPPPSFTTVDTTFSYGTGSWKATFRVPDNLYPVNGADSGQCIIFFPGAGEAGNGYGVTGLAKFGPLDYVSVGWDGGVVLGNGTHYPIIVAVEQIGDFPYNVKERIAAVVTAITNRFRIKKKNGTPCVHLTGLSAGGYTAQVMVMSDPYSTTGPWPIASKVRSVCNVQGVKPNDFSNYPLPIQNFARAGGRMASFEGSLDGRDMATVINSMNSAVANSGILTTLTGIMSTHCCWNYFYGGDGNGTTYSSPATFLLDGVVQDGYQWMLRQGDTTIGGSTNPAASAGGNQSLFYPVNTTIILNGKASAAGSAPIVSYAWTKVSGSSCTILSPSADSTGVTITAGGTYVFQLVVTDNLGHTGTDQATISVSAPPIVNAGVDQTITQPTSSITMAASSSDEGSISRSLLSKFFVPGQAVNRVAFIGSSTCFGYGVPADSGWVYRTWHYWKSLGLVDTCYNMGVTSTDIYMARPTGSTPVANRSAPDPTININAACSKPGVKLVIVNYNNGYDFMSASEVMNVCREIQAYAASLPTPIPVWFTTAQPREGYSSSEQLNLKIISDSTKLAFPTTYLDFYYPTVLPGTTTRRPQFALGDNVHFNSNGHAQLYKEAVGFNPLQSIISSSSVITNKISLTSTVTSLGLGSTGIMVASIDNDSLMNNDYMAINVNPSSGVQANAGADINIFMPITTAQLNGSSSSGTGLSYSWIKIDSPVGSKTQEGVIQSPTSAVTNVTNLGYGVYKYKLTVTNGGTPSTDTVSIIGNRQRSRQPSTLPPVTYSLVPNGGEYYYPNILNVIPGLKGGDTLYLTQSAGTTQFYGAGADGGWGGDSTMKLAIRAAPGVVIGASMRIDGQYIDISGIRFVDNGTRRAGIVLGEKHSNVEVSKCYMTGGENFIYDKCPVDSNDVLTYGDSWHFNNDYLHDNYTIDSKGEAYYCGHTFTFDGTQPAQGYVPTKLYNCTITKDTVINSTWDGIQTSNGINYTVTHNYVSGTGLDSISSQAFGIILGGYTTGRVDSNYIKLSWSSGIAAFGYDTMRITGNTIDTCGFYDVITRNPFVYNPFTSLYVNDNIVSWIGTPSPTLVLKATGNCISHVSTYTGGAAIKNANGGGTSRPGIISGNTIYDAAGRTLSNLIVSNVGGETISGNTLGTCNSGNVNPFVNAGPDVNVTADITSGTLNGTATDIDGYIVSYLWTQVSGPNTATIASPTTASTGVSNLVVGTYTFRLTATDNQGASISDDVKVTLRVKTGKKAIGQKNVYF